MRVSLKAARSAAARPYSTRLSLRILSTIRNDKRASVAAIVAVAASSLFGMAALATEAGNWYLVRRNAQSAVDAAAMAAAISMMNGASSSSITAMGLDVASRNGFTNGGLTSITVTANTAASPASLSVTLEQTQELLLARIAMGQPPVVRASAHAEVISDPGGACVLALNNPVTFAGNSNVQAPNCGFASNYRNPNSFKFGSGGSDAGSSFTARLSSLVSTGGCLTCTTAQNTLRLTLTRHNAAFYQAATPNPYSDLNNGPPTNLNRVTGCSNTNQLDQSADGAIVSLPPNYLDNSGTVYNNTPCYSRIRVNGGKTLQLSPGIYVISGGDFYVGGGTSVVCPTCTGDNGVNIVLTSNNSGSNAGYVSIQANSRVNLPARNSRHGTGLDGVLFYRDARAPDGTSNGSVPVSIAGGPDISLRGAIVAPSSSGLLIGSSTTNAGDPAAASSCTVLVVKGMTFQGGAGLDTSGCDSMGVRKPALSMVRLTS